jgi:hypothetical protein
MVARLAPARRRRAKFAQTARTTASCPRQLFLPGEDFDVDYPAAELAARLNEIVIVNLFTSPHSEPPFSRSRDRGLTAF